MRHCLEVFFCMHCCQKKNRGIFAIGSKNGEISMSRLNIPREKKSLNLNWSYIKLSFSTQKKRSLLLFQKYVNLIKSWSKLRFKCRPQQNPRSRLFHSHSLSMNFFCMFYIHRDNNFNSWDGIAKIAALLFGSYRGMNKPTKCYLRNT